MPSRVLAVAAHPDDIEFVMSGTMILLGQAGYELHYLNLANGSCGTTEYSVDEIVRIRRAESQRAAGLIGACYHESLTSDLEIFYEPRLLRKVASVVRQVAPTILLIHSPQDYMEDHMNACRLATSAAFARGMPNYRVDPPWDPTEVPVTLYHAQPHGNCDELRRPIRPSIIVDVSDEMDRKRQMLACHESQKKWLDESQGMDSYLRTMEDLASQVARFSGRFAFAEGWRRHSHLGFCDEGADPLSEAIPIEKIHHIVSQ